LAAVSRFWLDQGKRDEARELLAPVYGFTEGFDTLDLKEAKALLDVLGAQSVADACQKGLPEHVILKQDADLRIRLRL
jgi:hypothetical protein